MIWRREVNSRFLPLWRFSDWHSVQRSFLNFLLLLVLEGFLFGCIPNKVPLRYDPPRVKLTGAHWYQAEEVLYFFYRLHGARQVIPENLLEWSVKAPWDENSSESFQRLDFEKAVHHHQLMACDEDLCGSYSFRLKEAPRNLRIHLKFAPQSPLFAEDMRIVTRHYKGNFFDAYSHLVYGTFDDSNQKVRIHVLPNFGTPTASEIADYGLSVRLRISEAQLFDWTKKDLDHLYGASLSPTLFSNWDCNRWARPDSTDYPRGAMELGMSPQWMPDHFPLQSQASGICFRANLLDQKGTKLTTAQGIARRNPEVDFYPMSFRTPLREVEKIPVVLTYCPTEGPAMWSQLFLEYQKFIFQAQDASIDLCFRIGQEEIFEEQLRGLLAKKLQKVREISASAQDYIFTVILNHRLNSEFQSFQESVARQLNLFVESERNKMSPRLVGAFVYDSSADFEKTPLAHKDIIWCPQTKATEEKDMSSQFDAGINCAVSDGQMVTTSLLNFLVPMGPFPSLKTYEDYFYKYGDKGFIHDPQLQVDSVPVNSLTVHDYQDTSKISFFEGQTMEIANDEALRVCYENDVNHVLLPHLSFKTLRVNPTILNISELQTFLHGQESDLVLQLGLRWEFPFFGAIRYTLPLNGSVLSVIPFSKDLKAQRSLGDKKWVRQIWSLDKYFQKCRRFCDHPYFDASGTYQIGETWRDQLSASCIQTKIPRYEAQNDN